MESKMKILSLLLLFITQSYAQLQFEVAVGGSSCDNGYYVIQTSDGGYALCGNSEVSTDPFDMYIVKLDPMGILQWTQKIGGANGEWAKSIIQTADGGYIAAGFTGSYGAGGQDMYIVKLSPGGNVLWNKTIGGTLQDYAQSIKSTTDGGFIVAGFTRSFGAGDADIFMVKFDSTGNILWSETVGGTGYDEAIHIIQTSDGGYAIAGITNSFGAGSNDMYILKLDSSGNVNWNRTFGGTGIDEAYSIIQTTDNGYVAVGETNSFGTGNYDFYAVKLDSSGNLLWSKTVGSTQPEGGESVIETPDGGYAIAGFQQRLIKLGSDGTLQWSRSLPIVSICIINTIDGGYAVGGSAEIGDCRGLSILKFDGNWNTCNNTNSLNFVQGSVDSNSIPVPIVSSQTPVVTTPAYTSTSYGGITDICAIVPVELISFTADIKNNDEVVLNWRTSSETNNKGFDIERKQKYEPDDQMWEKIGFVEGHGTSTKQQSYFYKDENLPVGIYQYRLKQIDFEGSYKYSDVVEAEIKAPIEFTLEQNYPNPFNPSTILRYGIPRSGHVKLSVYNLLGEKVALLVNEFIEAGFHEVTFNAASVAGGLPSGAYIYTIESGGSVIAKKMLLMK
jgi:hypothetical protein